MTQTKSMTGLPLWERKTELAKHHFGFWPTGLQPDQTHLCPRSCKVAEHGAAHLLVCYALHGYLPWLECKPKKRA